MVLLALWMGSLGSGPSQFACVLPIWKTRHVCTLCGWQWLEQGQASLWALGLWSAVLNVGSSEVGQHTPFPEGLKRPLRCLPALAQTARESV